MPSRVSRMTLRLMTCPVEFQMWMPLPRRFWSSATTHSSPSAGFSPFCSGSANLRRLGAPDDGVPLDPGAVGLPDVDAVQSSR